jgi:hypothetical protein
MPSTKWEKLMVGKTLEGSSKIKGVGKLDGQGAVHFGG